MYNAIDIARYVIFHENQAGRIISNLRLQKLLYFIQAQFLVAHHEPCFSDRIEAWDFGPVVPNVYHEYKIFGSSNIPASQNNNSNTICKNDCTLIDNILQQASRYSTSQLVSITHNQKPWKNAYTRIYDNEITNADILNYFEAK